MIWVEGVTSGLTVAVLTWVGRGFWQVRRQHAWLLDSMEKVLAALDIKNGKAPGR